MILSLGFVLFMVIGVPIAFVLGLTALLHVVVTGNSSFYMLIPQKMFNGIDNFGLMAIPFFILAGELMNYGGIAKRLVSFARVLVGHLRGGLAYVNVVASAFLAAIMGSATAEASAMTPIMVPAMEEDGYDKEFSTALTASAAIMGPIIPPSMVFIVYAVSASVSIGAMFFAGIIPGLMLALAFSAVIYYKARTGGIPVKQERVSAKKFGRALVEAGPSLSVPLIMLGGILGGVFTPTESAVAASVVALIIGIWVHKELKWSDLEKILLNTGLTSAAILLIMSTATVFGLTLTIEQIPQAITEGILSISDNKLVVLLMMNVLMLIVGMFMETLAAMIVLIPVMLPIIVKVGIDPLHFGIVLSLNAVIGLITPPVGLNLFICSSIAGIKLERLSRAVIPFVIASLLVLVVVTYWPSLILFLPNLLF